MTVHQRDDDATTKPDSTSDDLSPEEHKPGFIEKLKDLFTPDDEGSEATEGHTMEDWEVSTLESGADQGPH